MNFTINVSSLLETLPIMGLGMLGIFVVMIVIALSISLLKRFFH